MIGPLSTPSSTKWTVTPTTFTPYSSACSIAPTPGNAGSSAGCTLMIRPAKRRMKPGVEQLHEAGEHHQLDAALLEPIRQRLRRAPPGPA